MNDQRLQWNGDLYVTLSKGGHSRNSGACVLGEVDIEEALMAELLHQTADLYIDAYERKGLKIGPEVMKDLAEKQVGVVATRKERSEILARLDELKTQKTKTDYLAMIPKFITAATSIGHIIAPYLPALMEKAE